MCSIGYHGCPECHEEIKCEIPDVDCNEMQSYDWICAKCEWWIEEERKEHEKYDQMMRERAEWEREEWERLDGKN